MSHGVQGVLGRPEELVGDDFTRELVRHFAHLTGTGRFNPTSDLDTLRSIGPVELLRHFIDEPLHLLRLLSTYLIFPWSTPVEGGVPGIPLQQCAQDEVKGLLRFKMDPHGLAAREASEDILVMLGIYVQGIIRGSTPPLRPLHQASARSIRSVLKP